MSEWELCDLFGVTAPTFRAGLKALARGSFKEYEIKRTIACQDNCCMEVYSLEATRYLRFRFSTGVSDGTGTQSPFLKRPFTCKKERKTSSSR